MEQRLKVYVERIVRPIAAEESLKDRLREELWGHLQALYADELAQCGNAWEALAKTQDRLGEPANIRRDFLRSLSPLDRAMGWFDYAFELQPGENPWGKALRVTCASVTCAIALTLVLMASAYANDPHDTNDWLSAGFMGLGLILFQPIPMAAMYGVMQGLRRRYRRAATLVQRLGYTLAGQAIIAIAAGISAVLTFAVELTLSETFLGFDAQCTIMIKHVLPVMLGAFGGIVALTFPPALLIDHYYRRRLPDWPYATD